MTDQDFDQAAYLARIGAAAPVRADRAGLDAILRRHAEAIPFESIDPFLGRGVRIDLASIMDKLVHRRLGGYCFEHNLLLLAALRSLGFRADPRLARVIRGQADDAMTPRSHVMLCVSLPEGEVLADVGFGNLTPTAAIPFAPGAVGATPHETYRLDPAGAEHILRARLGEAWEALYRLGPETPPPIDLELANWFTATHPASPFTGNLVIARPIPGGRRTLFNTRLAERDASGTRTGTLDSVADLDRVLRTGFGLALAAEEVEALFAAIRDRPENGRFRAVFA